MRVILTIVTLLFLIFPKAVEANTDRTWYWTCNETKLALMKTDPVHLSVIGEIWRVNPGNLGFVRAHPDPEIHKITFEGKHSCNQAIAHPFTEEIELILANLPQDCEPETALMSYKAWLLSGKLSGKVIDERYCTPGNHEKAIKISLSLGISTLFYFAFQKSIPYSLGTILITYPAAEIFNIDTRLAHFLQNTWFDDFFRSKLGVKKKD